MSMLALRRARIHARCPANLPSLHPAPAYCRGLVSNPFTSPMQVLQATRTLPYAPEGLYSVIADVGQYSKFLPYCLDSTVFRWSSPDTDTGKRWPAEARLTVGWGNIHETFASKVYCAPGHIVEAVGGDAKSSLSLRDIPHYNSVQDVDGSQKVANSGSGGEIMTHLLTRWTLRPLPSLPGQVSECVAGEREAQVQTEVQLAVEFQFANPLYDAMSRAFAPKVADLIVDAFENRVTTVLGPTNT